MNTTDKVKLAEFLARDYPFDVRVMEGACPKCFHNGEVHVKKSVRDSKLDSPTSKFEARRKRFELWMELFDNGLDPIQCINAYIPASQRAAKVPKFPEPLIVLSKLGEPCKNNPNCFPRCLLCDGEMGQLPSITLAPWNFPVHECCTDPCGYTPPGAARGVCCETRVLTIPKLFKDTLNITIRCAKHGSHGITDAKKPAMEVARVTTSKDVQTATPQPTEKPVRPAMPKPKPPPRKPLKIERVKEKGCHDIVKMLCPDRQPTTPKSEPTGKRLKPDHPHFEPASSKGPGATFLYGAKKFDFTEPRRLFPSEDLSHEKNEDEASPGAGDGEDRGAP